MVLIHTGCRRQEAWNLKWSDVDLANNILNIATGKTGWMRHVNMGVKLRTLLENKPRNSAWVLCNNQGGQMKAHFYDNRFNKFKLQSRVDKPWTAHDLRHTFAYHFLKDGGHVYQLQAILGHKNIKMTVDLYGQLQSREKVSPFE